MSAFILVVGIIIAAGALFTAVYDVIYKYNSSNTINLNAATVDKTGQTNWGSSVGDYDAERKLTFNFDEGTWMVFFWGQYGQPRSSNLTTNGGVGAECIAFFKGSNMKVTTTLGGIAGYRGGGKTIVTTNFALPVGYTGTYEAIASGGGAGNPSTYAGYYPDGVYDLYKVMDGTFKGKSGNNYWNKLDQYGSIYRKIAGNNGVYPGTPASQTGGGAGATGGRYPDGYEVESANLPSGEGGPGCGGGAGYYDGGFGISTRTGGGGSCTPWCYPIIASDLEWGPKENGRFARTGFGTMGGAWFFRIDPNGELDGAVKEYGESAVLDNRMTAEYTPTSAGQKTDGILDKNFDCGIRTGWVYSVSEDGKSWQGVGPDDKLSASETQASDTQ